LARTKKTAIESIMSVLNRGPKRGLTATAIAGRAGLNLNTTRTALNSITGNLVEVVGRQESASRGRPANLYRAMAA
jgi:hypothetical protein